MPLFLRGGTKMIIEEAKLSMCDALKFVDMSLVEKCGLPPIETIVSYGATKISCIIAIKYADLSLVENCGLPPIQTSVVRDNRVISGATEISCVIAVSKEVDNKINKPYAFSAFSNALENCGQGQTLTEIMSRQVFERNTALWVNSMAEAFYPALGVMKNCPVIILKERLRNNVRSLKKR